ncbi:adenosine phosphosulfate reductase [Sulfurimonas gotlandica GD1]|uniref:Adenosine 5'-phosphosulfate reductase n=1 Tax=Sulfurimonas gotlandica (strain DSM 19862 / JCM 16533 / GD1) TaxID=929558 RepID=B6BNF7_SULGG|nr:phosphoadenylyl-sulfate reductase [Sulfurimonas gotlandica]EDZ61394.1 APS-reductase [Sulfurimonas gotlandica GD1]EHP31027.1 adenosine phosphosulfate reductase [Sulfurimonas gotlandica GD1]
MKDIVNQLNEAFKNSSTLEVLEYLLKLRDKNISLSSSFGAEDQVLTDMMLRIDERANIFTLDTGRLPDETYAVMNETNLRYQIKIKVFFPKAKDIEDLYQKQGANGFYESIENRKSCCFARKIAPLKRALKNVDFWVTGLRSAQSVTREDMKLFEFDETNNVIKVSPLKDWSEEDVWAYIKSYRVPYNKLHKLGYPSIGCAPCTRPVREGGDIRSGRWWWENPEHKECGLHLRSA